MKTMIKYFQYKEIANKSSNNKDDDDDDMLFGEMSNDNDDADNSNRGSTQTYWGNSIKKQSRTNMPDYMSILPRKKNI
jgi:hypothetical protein